MSRLAHALLEDNKTIIRNELRGEDVNKLQSELGDMTPLGFCLENQGYMRSPASIEYLIKTLKANPNGYQDKVGHTALTKLLVSPVYYPTIMPKTLEILLKNGADPNTPDKLNQIPIMVAAGHKFSEFNKLAVSALLAHGGSYDALLIQYIVKNKSNEIRQILTKHRSKIDINVVTVSGNSYLHQAAKRAYDIICEILLKNGINPNIQNKEGNTALHEVFRHDQLKYTRHEILSICLKYNANPNLTNNEGQTVLMLAVKAGDLECIDLLLEYNADMSIKDKAGKTAKHYTTDMKLLKKLSGYTVTVQTGKKKQIIFKYHYDAAKKTLLSCPTNLNRFFINTNRGNCWIDATMIALTFSDDLGQSMRAALLGYLQELEKKNVDHPEQLVAIVEKWKASNSWQTYVIRMLLLLLLGSDAAQEWLTCPLVDKKLEKFQWLSIYDKGFRKLEEMKDAKLYGAWPEHGAIRLLLPLVQDDMIIVQKTYNHVDGKQKDTLYFDIGYGGPDEIKEKIKDYKSQIRIYSVKRSEPGKSGAHAITAFFCGDAVYFYDDNQGMFLLEGHKTLPTNMIMEETLEGTQYEFTFENGSKLLVKGEPVRYIEKRMYKMYSIVEVFTKDVYKRIREGARFKVNTSHPSPVRLTAGPVIKAPVKPPVKPLVAVKTLNEQLSEVVLSSASVSNKISALRKLVSDGADPTVGVIPAQQRNDPDIVEALLDFGAKFDPAVMFEFATSVGYPRLLAFAREELRNDAKRADASGNKLLADEIRAKYDIDKTPSPKRNKTKKQKRKNSPSSVKATRKQGNSKDCAADKIYNPATGRCVSRTGTIGKKLVKDLQN